MATYKVIQDIEAEDKLVGPLTLRQCIYAAAACLSLYICFLLFTKGAPFLMIPFLPIAAGAGFFAFPWQGEQPTEIWALARLRYMLKPRVRIWDQDGTKDLVTVLAPKKIEQKRSYKDTLTQREVRSRLKALANTIDSRGWATRNAAYGLANQQWVHPTVAPVPGSMPIVDSNTNNDIFDPTNSVAQNFDVMLAKSSEQQRQHAIRNMNNAPATNTGNFAQYASQAPELPAPVMPPTQPGVPQQQNWFVQGPAYPTAPTQSTLSTPPVLPRQPQPSTFIESDVPLPVAATPTPTDTSLSEDIRQRNDAMSVNYGHLRVLQPSQPETPGSADSLVVADDEQQTGQPVTHTPDPAILELANNDDLDIATIARQASKQAKQSPDEVEIRLH